MKPKKGKIRFSITLKEDDYNILTEMMKAEYGCGSKSRQISFFIKEAYEAEKKQDKLFELRVKEKLERIEGQEKYWQAMTNTMMGTWEKTDETYLLSTYRQLIQEYKDSVISTIKALFAVQKNSGIQVQPNNRLSNVIPFRIV